VLRALALLVALGWGLSEAQAADGAAMVRTDPPSVGLRTGEQATLAIRAENVDNLYGAELHLRFNPAVVEVVDADPSKPDVQIKPGDWLKDSFVAANRADNAAGTVDYAATLLNPAPPVSGGGVLATITFRAKANGVSALAWDKVILATREAKEIKAVAGDGVISVSADGKAPEVTAPVVAPPAAGPAPAAPAANPAPAAPAAGPASAGPSTAMVAAGIGVLAFTGALAFLVFAIRRRRR